jgi:hypothetical protein
MSEFTEFPIAKQDIASTTDEQKTSILSSIGSTAQDRSVEAESRQPNPLNGLAKTVGVPASAGNLDSITISGLENGGIRNLAPYSFDPDQSFPSSSYYNVVGSSTFDDDEYIDVKIDGQTIRLFKFTCSQFLARLRHNVSGVQLNWFETDKKYLVSLYALRISTPNDLGDVAGQPHGYAYQRFLSGTSVNAAGKRLVDRSVRRIATLGLCAGNDDRLDFGSVPTDEWGDLANDEEVVWLQPGDVDTTTQTFYIGGFQVEMVSDDAKDGLIWTGDSTMANFGNNLHDAQNVPILTESIVGGSGRSIMVQNVAEGGKRLDELLDNYVDDILPIQQSGKYRHLIVQGGVNDINQESRTLADMQDSFNSFAARAESVASIAFTSGGTTEIVDGDTITGATSGATAVVKSVHLESGTWAGGDAAGTLFLETPSGTFQAEEIEVSATNVGTISGDAVTHDALQMVACTSTGANDWNAAQYTLKGQLNDWIRGAFPFVLDIAAWSVDKIDSDLDNQAAALVGDGTHASPRMREYVAERCASQLIEWFAFPEPSRYQRRTGASTIAYDYLTFEQTPQPDEPETDKAVIWLSNGTGHGDEGDLMVGSNEGGTSTYGTLFDQSGGTSW